MNSVQKSSCTGRADILIFGFPKWKQKHMQTHCKMSCRCVGSLTLFEWLLCRIYSAIIWVHAQCVHGSSSESHKRTVHICKGTWLLGGNCLCQPSPASWSYGSDRATAPTPAMPGNFKQIARAQRECTEVSLPTATPASPFLYMLSSCHRPLLEKG